MSRDQRPTGRIGFLGVAFGVVSIERQMEHPLVGFLSNETLTWGHVNLLLVLFGPLFAVGGVIEGSVASIVAGVVFMVIAAWKYRVYRRRLRRAVAATVPDSALER